MSDPTICTHADHVAVETSLDGQVTVVAHLCLDCDAQLHPGWGCPACQWTRHDVTTFSDPHPRLHHALTRPCREHA